MNCEAIFVEATRMPPKSRRRRPSRLEAPDRTHCSLTCRLRPPRPWAHFEAAHGEIDLLGTLHHVVPVDLGLARELLRSELPELTSLEASINAKKRQNAVEADAKEAESLRRNGTPAFFGRRRFDHAAAGT